ncbi:BnaC03g64250D [Brassica napus]|uniref:BnaC03g64250D protein n=1 Tax=Brassica napus TaxID=3708 RepID=A0A078ID27_BRANA|nr:BnaC03g64250D [Brassica napus]
MFYGEDPERWVEWIDALVAAHKFTVFKTRKFMYGFIEGHALSWYGDEISRYGFSSWDDLKVRLLNRFSTSAKQEKEQLEQSRLLDILKEMNDAK